MLSDLLFGRRKKLRDILEASPNATESSPEQEEPSDVPAPEVQETLNGHAVQVEPLPVPPGMCSECEDQPASVGCDQCGDDYCDVCFRAQHRRGQRSKHVGKPLNNEYTRSLKRPVSNAQLPDAPSNDKDMDDVVPESSAGADAVAAIHGYAATPSATPADADLALEARFADWITDRAKYIPIRLSLDERKILRLLEAALNVSEYTDKIDILMYHNKPKRIFAQIREICAILCGLVVASNYQEGQALIRDKSFSDNAAFFQRVFEIGRRHKIMNPEKMRGTYGKLVYMLQDSMLSDVKDMLQFSCVSDLRTVYRLLADRDALAVLRDPRVATATKEIISDGKSRREIQGEIKAKERAIEDISRKFATANLSTDEIKLCLYSIGDNHSFLRGNRDPCDKMIAYLETYFSPERVESGYDLSICMGRNGSRLTHDHYRQYHYCVQSLTLWRDIQHDMFRLWCVAEDDLLREDNGYRLRDTGQGLNRIQSAPLVSRLMHTLVHNLQRRVNWIGSSVIHLGDHNVPNALMFIDKYTQVARILNPIVLCIEKIEEFQKNAGIMKLVEATYGTTARLKKEILRDFFRFGFDGSGADNFYDAGSCIDGRLTSAWNWCAQIEKKPFFPFFLLSGFVGFDGQFS